MVRLLHIADLHIGAPLGGFGEHADERGRQVLESFRKLPEIVAENDVAVVLIAGDLFDSPHPPDSLIAAVGETVRRLREAEVHVFAVPGNHDARFLNPPLYADALRGACVFTEPAFGRPQTVEIQGEPLHVYGIAYDPAEEPDPLGGFRRAEEPGLHVVLLHGSVPGAPHWQGGSALRLAWEGLDALDVDYIALGDHHRFRSPEGFEKPRLPACYCGSFAALDLTETGPHGAALVEVASGQPPQVRLLASDVPPVVRLERFDVTPYDDEAAIVEAVYEELPDSCVPAVCLVGTPAFLLNAETIREWLSQRYGYAAVSDETRYYESARLLELARQKTVAGHVVRLGSERIREAAGEEERRVAEEGLRVALRALAIQ